MDAVPPGALVVGESSPGGSSGIGLQVAEAGATTFICARDEGARRLAADEIHAVVETKGAKGDKPKLSAEAITVAQRLRGSHFQGGFAARGENFPGLASGA